ncbi:hypothetical protein SDC9_64201 [bioreactor metagenome]|uniref:Uncharacterized protein n=1 Tax=bioreactor metagenome TaxID=1076179 RepID=A0A644XNM8_9ZZZZ|nr:hypothetical protein [Candidatus Metalachnospira sp.]
MNRTSISIIVMLFLCVGAFVLQIFLSKRDSRWAGLVLPIITFAYSLLAVFGMAAYVGEPMGQVIMQAISILVITNIPTFILLAIYFALRHERRKNKEINKMNIKDL